MGEDVKKLTQVQKNYFIKRIDGITAKKISKVRQVLVTANDIRLGYSRHYVQGQSLVSETAMDKISMGAIVSGKIKLLSKKDVAANLKSLLKDNDSTSTYSLPVKPEHFVDKDSLIEFNKVRNKKVVSKKKEQDTSVAAVEKEASKLKDKVMLEGNLVVEMLEEFEKKEF